MEDASLTCDRVPLALTEYNMRKVSPSHAEPGSETVPRLRTRHGTGMGGALGVQRAHLAGVDRLLLWNALRDARQRNETRKHL